MFISDEEAERRLNDTANLFRQIPADPEDAPPDLTEIKPLHRGGRTSDQPNMTHKERVTVATMADAIGNKKTEELTGVSSAQIEQLKAGEVGHAPNMALAKDLREVRTGVEEKAIDLVMSTLSQIDTDKLEKMKTARELAGVAKDLSSVAERMSDKSTSGPVQNNIVFYVPNSREEEAYSVVDVEPQPAS
jgi:hypothetical protein